MKVDLKDKVCVVTGAAKSIGFAIANAYIRAGAKVVMIDIDPLVLDSAKGLGAVGYLLDITNRDEVLKMFAEITQEIGPVFALVNNAGIVGQSSFEEITAEEIDKIMRVNVNGTLFCCQGAVSGMRSLGNGRIINFSSKSGKTGSALMAHYSAAKGAVIALTHALAFELAKDNIKVNCLCPGITESTGVWGEVSKGYVQNMNKTREEIVDIFTSKIPLKRLTQIDDVVEWVMFLTEYGDYCTGQAYNITGGREMH